jgi:antitoxin ParD1/3/4
MAAVEILSIAISGEQAASIREVIARGEYSTTTDVISEALREWHAKRSPRHEDIEQICAIWDASIASGSAGPVDFSQIRQEARERLADSIKSGSNAG